MTGSKCWGKWREAWFRPVSDSNQRREREEEGKKEEREKDREREEREERSNIRLKIKHARKRYTVHIYILQTCNIYIYPKHKSEKNPIEMDARESYGLL